MTFKILLLLFIANPLFSKDNYYVTYEDITLGKIINIDTLKDGYLIAIPTNSWLKFIFNFDNYIVYEEDKKPKVKGKNRYSKDTYYIIDLVNQLGKGNLKDTIVLKRKEQVITIECKDNKCKYQRYNTKNEKIFKGFISFDAENKLKEICDDESDICIKKK